MIHTPVLIKEVIEYLQIKANKNYIDGTVGQGGHALSILENNGPEGKLLGIDLDPVQIENSTSCLSQFGERVVLINDSYVNIQNIVKKLNFGLVDGILLDLGYSSWHLEESKKGFSFKRDEILDMRYGDSKDGLTAEIIINEWPETEIERILREYGQERFSKQITKKIIEERKTKRIKTTFALRDIIVKTVGSRYQKSKIDPATRTFQALRIEVNKELSALEKFLPEALNVLATGGRLVVISFHSLEDALVKQFFKAEEKEGIIKMLSKKPVLPTKEEVAINKRARSAKLRAVVKL